MQTSAFWTWYRPSKLTCRSRWRPYHGEPALHQEEEVQLERAELNRAQPADRREVLLGSSPSPPCFTLVPAASPWRRDSVYGAPVQESVGGSLSLWSNGVTDRVFHGCGGCCG
jgi:hypothetical protein